MKKKRGSDFDISTTDLNQWHHHYELLNCKYFFVVLALPSDAGR
jgi:hypothetical protein